MLELMRVSPYAHHPQVISSDMESVWRMFVIRENASKRALWKG